MASTSFDIARRPEFVQPATRPRRMPVRAHAFGQRTVARLALAALAVLGAFASRGIDAAEEFTIEAAAH